MPRRRKVKFKRKGKTPKQRIQAIRRSVDNSLGIVFRKHLEYRDLATKGWSARNKPKFKVTRKYTANTKKRYTWFVTMKAKNAEKASIPVYLMLNKGTRIRHARMPEGFRAKTRPGRLGLFGPGGRPVAISRRLRYKGIEERDFEGVINAVMNVRTNYPLTKGIRRGFKS